MLAAAGGAHVLAALGAGRSSRRLALAAAGWCAAVALVVASLWPEGLGGRLQTLLRPSEDRSIQFRLGLWRDSLALAARSPWVGCGLGAFADAIPAYRRDEETRAEFAESDLVQLLCEAGAAGVGIFFGFALAVWRALRRKLSAAERWPRGVLLGGAAAASALALHGLCDFNARIPSNALHLATLLGALAGGTDRAASPLPAARGIRYAAAALCACVSLGAGTRAARIGWSRHLAVSGEPGRAEALAPGNPQAAFERGRRLAREAAAGKDKDRYREWRLAQAAGALSRAVQLAPARGAYWFELGWTEARRGNDPSGLFEHGLRLDPARADLRRRHARYLEWRANRLPPPAKPAGPLP
jgi:hypothetical protein